MNADDLLKQIERRLSKSNDDQTLLGVLDEVVSAFGCAVGTIHRFDQAAGLLRLVAHRGVPPPVLQHIEAIAPGKGMAGLAAQRRECISVCNLQTDSSGAARPNAKMTGMEGSIAVPMLADGQVCGVLGVAKPTAYDFSKPEQQALLKIAAMIGSRLGDD